MKAPENKPKKPKPAKRKWQRKPPRRPTLAQVARWNAAAMVGVKR